ncbi:DUF4153 domain-containing protein [Marinimicrobium alkaliphilum]|uniref:DUF4153 domain-containing protein n=1 Tax=Marinimicrobium alkaliphilum TaxID=2202654 RepID=UPI000DB9146F|nr:DUF4153 domain-containing protein [Marinimicrobium alkaliphilum]
MNDLSRENRLAFMVLAVVQSLVLLLLHKAIEHEVWPSTHTSWLFAGYTVAIGLPLFLYVGAVEWRDRANAVAALVLAPVLFWVGWHHGWLSEPSLADTDYRYFGGLGALGYGMPIALFILGFFFRTWREQGRLDYAGLLENSWRNALTLKFLGLFLLVFWLLLLLWAMLFSVLEVDFFKTLFSDPVFIYPVSGLVVGWGLGLIRAREGMVATVRRLCEALTRALLPLIGVILILFLAVLPFTGIQLLWETGYAAALMLWLAVVLLYFANAAMADDMQPFGESPWLRRLLMVAMIVLPVTLVLALWSLGLRIDQYGLTLGRLWGLLVALFTALFSVGYAVLIVWKRGLPAQHLHRWNTWLGGGLALVLVLVNTPSLDFHKLSAQSQVTRLERGATAVDDFDVLYLRFNLGSYGVRALQQLQEEDWVVAEPDLLARIEAGLAARTRWQRIEPEAVSGVEQRRERVHILPGTVVSDSFLAALDVDLPVVRGCLSGEHPCVVGDLDYAGDPHRVVASVERHWLDGQVWRWRDDQWVHFGRLQRLTCEGARILDPEQPFVPLQGAYALVTNGGCVFQMQPSEAQLAE